MCLLAFSHSEFTLRSHFYTTRPKKTEELLRGRRREKEIKEKRLNITSSESRMLIIKRTPLRMNTEGKRRRSLSRTHERRESSSQICVIWSSSPRLDSLHACAPFSYFLVFPSLSPAYPFPSPSFSPIFFRFVF